jgi:hypothetical protein
MIIQWPTTMNDDDDSGGSIGSDNVMVMMLLLLHLRLVSNRAGSTPRRSSQDQQYR